MPNFVVNLKFVRKCREFAPICYHDSRLSPE